MSDDDESIVLRRIDETTARTEHRVCLLERRMGLFETRLTGIDKRLNVLTEWIGRLDDRLALIDRYLDPRLKAKIDALMSRIEPTR